MEREKQNPVVVKLSKNAGIENTENLHAYVVNSSGKIVESAWFDGGEATLESSKSSLEGHSKVYIAQALPEGFKGSQRNERTLLKMGAYEAVKAFDGNELTVHQLPPIVVDSFHFYRCLITGHIGKNFTIDSQTKKLMLCDLRVHVCQVESELIWPHIPIYYERIPDWLLHEVAGKILNFPPDPIGPISGEKINLPLSSLTQKRAIQARPKSAPSVNLPVDVINGLSSKSAETIRQTMINFHDLIYPYFCYWPIYWPYLYIIEDDVCVTTDCNGHFEVWEFLFGKNPLNIYIWVEAYINGHWVTVYRPAIPCHTYWKYKCGTDINITITDPRVTPCNCDTDGGPADAVWFRSIGESASALHIEQNMLSAPVVQGVSKRNVGCTDILGSPISPFGSTLAFKLFIGADIFNSGATHYRWKYTRVANENLVAISPLPAPTIIPGTISRPYLVKLSATDYKTHNAPLGPEGLGADIAYRIPHQHIADELPTIIPNVDQGLDPTWSNIFWDSAYLDSHALADGLYRFDLELLSQNAAGHFSVVAVNRHTYQVSEYNSINDDTNAPDNYLLPQNPALPAQSLSFNARIDNMPCTGVIHSAVLNETGLASGACGFIIYNDVTDHVHISFEASQPRDFATFDFNIIKGDGSQDTGIHPHGNVISSVGVFNLAGGLFSSDFKVVELLNSCPGQAAFSENLNVYALATDGTNRLHAFDYHDTVTNKDVSYDAGSVNAFALSAT